VRTKWQSSRVFSDNTPVSLKGNHKHGNVFVETGENLLDLRRKVNYKKPPFFFVKK